MIFLNEMKELQLYSRPFHLPINPKNKRKGDAIFLMTPNYESTKKLLLNPLLINRNYYESYYIEKVVTYYINNEGSMYDLEENLGILNESSMEPDFIVENSNYNNDLNNLLENSLVMDDQSGKLLFVDQRLYNDELFTEASNYNSMLHKILYKERFKSNKDVFKIYDKVIADVPYIKRTYINLNKYRGRNLFIDTSFYNKIFFENNKYKSDRGIDLYAELMSRYINDSRLDSLYNKRTVFLPVTDWVKDVEEEIQYNKFINPISMILRLINKKDTDILSKFKDIDFVFFGEKGYFKADISKITKENLSRFMALIRKLIAGIAIYDNTDKASTQAIVSDVVDKIEQSQKIKINNLTGDGKEIDKDQLVEKIEKAAAISKDADDAIDKMDNDDKIKELLQKLNDDEDGTIKINAARASRITNLQQQFLNKKVNNTTVKQMIENSKKDEPLPVTSLNIDSVNDEWKHLTYVNFEKVYNPDEDIVNILYSFSEKSVPVMVRELKVKDNSTSEDYVKLYTVEMEDALGSRFTLKFDIPELEDNKFMRLRGNQKSISGQLTLIPISKTDSDSVQIVSNYKKMFIRRYYTSAGKSYETVDRIMKVIRKNEFKELKISEGDSTRVCSQYELPIDYIDFASVYSRFEMPRYIIYFNPKEIREKYKVDESKGIPFGVEKKTGEILYYDGNTTETLSNIIASIIFEQVPGFEDKYKATSVGTKYTYSKVSILSTEIPLVVMMAFSEGLTKAMDKAGIEYEFSEKKIHDKNEPYDFIRYNDGYIFYKQNYISSLLMNGLKECDTENYSLSDVNKKSVYIDYLENFGGRLLSDGLDNFYDLMIDPITEEVLEKYGLPTDYVELLAHANVLLADNKYIAHTDSRGRRYRSNELIAGYTYQALAESYGSYRTGIRKKGKDVMVIKQSAVIDKIMADPTSADVSALNDLGLLETINSVSSKGLSGMNSDRSYGLDKRSYDDSMINILGLSTGFAGNVGLTRQATLDMNVDSKRGYLKVTTNTNDMNVAKTLTATEALTPFGTVRDDPFRSAMTFIQTSKHGMRVKNGTPSLISNGADQALPYLTPNIFSFKTKQSGKVIEKTDDYMVLKYKDGSTDFVDLRANIKKNSNGGFYTIVKLDTNLKEGSTFKESQIVAYDHLSYSDKVGDVNDGIAYNIGTLTKIAILNTDEGFEDSAIISDFVAEQLSSDIVVKVDVTLPKNCNIYNMVKKGTPIKEGDPLVIFQNAFEDEDMNTLLKNLAGQDDEISDLGRIRIKSKVTGVVQDIKIYRTVDEEELSDSLKKVVKNYEKPIKSIKKTMDKYGLDSNRIDASDKLESSGKLKNVEDGVLIEFYLKYEDRMSVGDKIVYYSALKGVVKDIFPIGKEPTTPFRPNEPLGSLLSSGSVNGRMVCSVKVVLAINKVLVELDRAVKEKLGIKWKNLNDM